MNVTGPRLKVARAREHLANLQGQVTQWLADVGPPHFTVEVRDNGRIHILRLAHAPAVPADWALLVGDMLHNLRSALDLLAWQAVIAGGGKPDKATCFPVFKKPNDKGVTVALKGAQHTFVDTVRQYQPYNRAEALRGDPLWLLHRLNIEDKHHLLVLCPSLVNTLGVNIQNEAVGARAMMTLQPAADGAELLRLVDLPKPMPVLDLQPSGRWVIWIAETEETGYVDASDLDVLFAPVERMIDHCEQHG